MSTPPLTTKPYLPVFGSFDSLDVIRDIPQEEMITFVTLQGLVNRSRPRIYVEQGGTEGAGVWLETLQGVAINAVADRWSLMLKYRQEIAGMVIADPGLPDTLNLATTIAGVENGVVVSPQVAEKLAAAPYGLPQLADLRRQRFASRAQVYRYARQQYWSRTTHDLIVGLDPRIRGSLRDYAVATRAMVIWLDPRNTEERGLLDGFLSDMPAGAPFLGYYPDPEQGGEQVHVLFLSEHAIPSFPADYFNNATVFAGTSHAITVPPIPPAPPLENKIYVSFILSDGDNVQYTEHQMRAYWDDPHRGEVPIGWTVNPALVDLAPVFLNFYWRTATQNDVLIAGPSGMGYTYPNHWPSQAALERYVQNSSRYMEQAGLRVITVWDESSDGFTPASAAVYAQAMPGLLGVTHQNGESLSLIQDRLPQIGLHPAYGDNVQTMEMSIWLATGILASMQKTNLSAPVFIAAQACVWRISPTDLFNLMNDLKQLSPEFVFVRPDHFFMLIREAHGLDALGKADR